MIIDYFQEFLYSKEHSPRNVPQVRTGRFLLGFHYFFSRLGPLKLTGVFHSYFHYYFDFRSYHFRHYFYYCFLPEKPRQAGPTHVAKGFFIEPGDGEPAPAGAPLARTAGTPWPATSWPAPPLRPSCRPTTKPPRPYWPPVRTCAVNQQHRSSPADRGLAGRPGSLTARHPGQTGFRTAHRAFQGRDSPRLARSLGQQFNKQTIIYQPIIHHKFIG